MNQQSEIILPNLMPSNEALRLEALRRFNTINTPAETAFDELTLLMQETFEVAAAFIALVDEDKIFFKSKAGTFSADSVPRALSLCSHTILQKEPTIFEDTRSALFLDSKPNVQTADDIKFYAGAPLITDDGIAIGAVCITDTEPRKVAEKEIKLLQRFAGLAMREMDTRLAASRQQATLENTVHKVLSELASFKMENQAYQLFLQAPLAITIFKGEDLLIDLANDTALQIAGKTKDIIGKKLADVLPEVENQGYIDILKGVYRTGKTFTAVEAPVVLHIKGAETQFYFNFIYQPFYDENGNIIGVLSFSVNVTDQVFARIKIEESEARARMAVDSAEMGTFEVDLVTNEIHASKRLDEIFGVAGSRDRNKYIAAIHPEDLGMRNKAYENAFQTGVLAYEARVVHPDASIRWIKVQGRIFFSEGNVPIKLHGVVLDITDHKRFADELSRQVRERTSELIKANELLQKKNEELDQFAYVASHDLQEPLRKIMLFNSVIRERFTIGEEVQHYLNKTSDAALRMNGLIKSLLDYSRVSNASVRFENVDLSVILKEVLVDYELLVEQKKAIIQNNELSVIQAIPLQMNQLFFNLVGNALKFTRPHVQPVLTITGGILSEEQQVDFRQLTAGRQYYKLSFSDNGIGFNQEYASKIFTIFQRLNERSQYGGYGIGLALCKKIAESHGGLIFAEGKLHQGACFTVILPVRQR